MSESAKVSKRCNPYEVALATLCDDNETVIMDAEERVILTGIIKSGSGFEFEYNRQEET